jgi:hypothetical protein
MPQSYSHQGLEQTQPKSIGGRIEESKEVTLEGPPGRVVREGERE